MKKWRSVFELEAKSHFPKTDISKKITHFWW